MSHSPAAHGGLPPQERHSLFKSHRQSRWFTELTNYGFDILNILQSPQPVRLAKELIRLNIVKSVSQDTRVREIKEVVFDDEPRFFEILPDQNADEHRRTRKTERRWQAIVVLETVSEGEVALRLDGIGLRT